MSKRIAENELTHDNWDQDQEEEEAGEFRFASKDVMKTREIKKGKRRMMSDDVSALGGNSAFKGFSFGVKTEMPGTNLGFKSFTMPPNTTINKALETTHATFNSDPGSVEMSSASSTASGVNAMLPKTGSSEKLYYSGHASDSVSATDAQSNNSNSEKSSCSDTALESQYRTNLRRLNESVVHWIGNHVKQNPYCILTPVFSDYEKYIKELDQDFLNAMPSINSKNESSADKKTLEAAAACETSAATTAVGFSFTPSSATLSCSSIDTNVAPTNTLLNAGYFGTSSKQNSGGTTSSFSFSAAPTSVFGCATTSTDNIGFGVKSCKDRGLFAPATGFSFSVQPSKEGSSTLAAGSSFDTHPSMEGCTSSSGIGFTFGSTLANKDSEQTAQKEGGEDETYVPPKAEVVDIKEADAFYTIRCKLYFKIDKEFQDRGIGTLYLKPCGEKTQLLIRAGTTLGNILLNIMLNKNIPTNQQDNKVTMVCIPNPPLDEKKPDSKPICMLIRVKTHDDAKELLKQINSHKL